MKRSRRLRTRIVWSTAVIAALAMTAIIATVVLGLAAITRNSVTSTLEDRVGVVSGAVASTGQGPSTAPTSPDDAVDDTTWLYGPDGAEIDGPRAGDRVQDVADSLAQVSSRTQVTRGERVYLAQPVRIGGSAPGTGVLVVSESLEPYESDRTEIVVALTLVGLLVTAGATGIAAWTVTRTLQPVESMAELAEDWSTQQLDARFDDRAGDDEIAHLGRTLNVLLDRVAGALRGEQRLTSELAHELRTPLTAIRGEAELAVMGTPDPATRERLDRVVALTARMSETITSLLEIARGSTAEGRSSTISTIVEQAVAHRRSDRVEVVADLLPEASSTRVAAPIEIAVRALSPLLDNAEQYAVARVVVSCTVDDRAVHLTVSDDGPGLAGNDPDRLFDAGYRVHHSEGAGLGLALARRAARSLGGDAEMTSPGSPTTFTISLPRA